MPVYESSSLFGLDYWSAGAPYLDLDSNSTVSSLTTNYYYRSNILRYTGSPGVNVTVSTNNVYVKDGGVWKQCVSVYVKVGGTYRRLENDKIYTKVGVSWKS